MKIGVLALQGAVREHLRMLERAGAEAAAVKRPEQLADLDGLVIPGGESTTISKLMHQYGLFDPIREMAASGKPLFGTCAGLILLAKRIEGAESTHLALMDITVRRNAFGRQRESFEADLPVAGVADDFRAVFIRAPYITEAGPGVDVLSRIDDKIVAVRQGHLLASAFHPELTDDVRMHAFFVEMVREASSVRAI
ncbi:pyridoxal phosphate synthase yaaE subunit [Planifilum fimeticola]|jgi:pyridoxal 5'-phosphate synthase pdxT subunit|uniref:Pyridoxal 5'-phosphate synthase subunit PdxT n=1 Tax=Planifilum fimeticola TaxID=201975 RepID=A0A2T0LIB0_9BACL|nr:pyridoxal 5'-phosphate synthase glutaminase subunit PdxT [Planifilum fimeticola]PRX42154.1 pyridoxal phosphate synthase yaaE subunit [Planifilum fimeticola]